MHAPARGWARGVSGKPGRRPPPCLRRRAVGLRGPPGGSCSGGVRRADDGPDVREADLAQRRVRGDLALHLADQVLGLAEGLVVEAVDLVLGAEDVLVRDVVRGEAAARGAVLQNDGGSGHDRLALHLVAHCDVRVEDLPLRLAVGRREHRHLLVPGELGRGEGRDQLAVHVRRDAHLREGLHVAAHFLPVVDDVVVRVEVVPVGALEVDDIPHGGRGVGAGGGHPGLVGLGHGLVGIAAQDALGLVADQLHALAEAQHAVGRLRELHRGEALLQLPLLRGDHQRAGLLLRQVVLDHDLAHPHVLIPVANAGAVVELGATRELLRGELHPDEGADGDGWLDGGGARRDKNPVRAAVLLSRG
mmetsp:Transcript_14744/g.44259  ORF Transcript_14744/g.44259 Transcript_14744/m.44259 type:complete len:361 (+) Transcript_14744:14-1096(+)